MPIIFDPQLFVVGFPKGFHFYDRFGSLKMVSFGYLKKSEISQTILQKSTTFINDFHTLGRIKSFVAQAHHF